MRKKIYFFYEAKYQKNKNNMEESSGIEFGTLLIKHLKNRHKAEKEQEEEDKKNKKKKFIQTFNIISKLRKRKNLENILNPHGAEIKAREPNAFINYDHGAIPGSSSTSSFIKPPPLPSPLKDLGDNLLAALSVSLINLPLCMAFATAGTMPPAVGIMSAFYCSIFIFLSDSKYSIISVPMSIALLSKPLVKSYGYIGYQMALFMSGLMMMGSLMTKLYKYMVVIPKCVMDGFMNGGVLGIFVDQMETIFCLDVNWKQLYDRPGDEFIGIQLVYGMGEVFKQWSNVNYLSAFLYFATIIGLFILMGSHPKQPWVLYVCLMGLAIGVFEGYLVHPDKQMIRLDKRYPKDELRFFSYPEIGSRKFGKMVSNPQFWFDSLSLAMIIMLESLITWGMMEIGTDQRFTSRPRNLFVVVISNLSSLITGSMGAGFVFERSFTNFETGAKSQWACLYQGLFCLSFGFLFFNSFQYIPAVIIDALMMGIQVKTIRFDELLFTYKNDFKLFASNVTVTIAMLFTRGSYSIYIGIFVYLLMFAKELMNPQNELTIAHANEGDEEDDDDKGLRHQSKKILLKFFKCIISMNLR